MSIWSSLASAFTSSLVLRRVMLSAIPMLLRRYSTNSETVVLQKEEFLAPTWDVLQYAVQELSVYTTAHIGGQAPSHCPFLPNYPQCPSLFYKHRKEFFLFRRTAIPCYMVYTYGPEMHMDQNYKIDGKGGRCSNLIEIRMHFPTYKKHLNRNKRCCVCLQ